MAKPDEGAKVTVAQHAALAVIAAAAEHRGVVFVTKSLTGKRPLEINRKTASALFRKGFVSFAGGDASAPPTAHLTPAGQAVLESLQRRQRRKERTDDE